MLKGINPNIPPELLYAMARMGQGDELAIVDANFPAHSLARHLSYDRVINVSTRLLPTVRVILSLYPLERGVDAAATCMQTDGAPEAVPEPIVELIPVLEEQGTGLQSVERFDFYEMARGCFAIVQTLDLRPYGNVILKKGALHPGQ